MMRLLFKSVVVVLLAVGIGNYLIYLKTGQIPIHDLRERWGSDWLVDMQEKYSPDQLAENAKKTVASLTQDESDQPVPTKVYKWTDANGHTHYGDKPANAGAEQVEVEIRNAISPPDNAHSNPVPAQTDTAQTPLEKARAAAELMKTRTQQQEAN